MQYKKGDIFEVTRLGHFANGLKVGDRLKLIDPEDGKFIVLDGESEGKEQWNCLFTHVRKINMTPCEKKGYKVGQVFNIIRGGGNFPLYGIVVLDDDNGSHMPWFVGIRCVDKDGYKRSVIDLEKVERVYPPEEKPDKVEVVCEGNTRIISRESAIAQGLLEE